MSIYSATTRGICVSVTPAFLDDHSDPGQSRYVWAYTIEIANQSDQTVQLTDRTWSITDGHGLTQLVQGPGVVGEQPILAEGDSFTYTSGCPLTTPSGVMVGHYTMRNLDGEVFDVAIPAFSLDSPYDRRVVN